MTSAVGTTDKLVAVLKIGSYSYKFGDITLGQSCRAKEDIDVLLLDVICRQSGTERGGRGGGGGRRRGSRSRGRRIDPLIVHGLRRSDLLSSEIVNTPTIW